MHAHAGLIGPNAVTRLAEALAAQVGSERTASIFGEAGQAKLLAAPPEKMVDEQIVTALHVAMRHIPRSHAADEPGNEHIIPQRPQWATLVSRGASQPLLGFIGEARVNVLRLNLALDAALR